MVSQPLLIDQHTGSAIYIETMCDDSFLNHLANAMLNIACDNYLEIFPKLVFDILIGMRMRKPLSHIDL